MRRLVVIIAVAACAGVYFVPTVAAKPDAWSGSRCVLQQALFNVRHPEPTRLQVAGGNRLLKEHGCTERVPGPKHWPSGQCENFEAVFLKTVASPSRARLTAANGTLRRHGCRQRLS